MNLLLLEPSDVIGDNLVRLSGRRLHHLRKVLNSQVGDTLKAGLLNGAMGTARVLRIKDELAELEVELTEEPPRPLPLILVLALPRPKMLKRILQTTATLGVKELHLINSYRVEKSYWQSPWLEHSKIHQQLILGLEQGVDTLLPRVQLQKGFKPFVEDQFPALLEGRKALLALPGDYPACPADLKEPATLVVGPEGGFIPYEIEKLLNAGCRPVSLGKRVLRVETAVTALLAKLF